jgi:hypothetical protein
MAFNPRNREREKKAAFGRKYTKSSNQTKIVKFIPI